MNTPVVLGMDLSMSSPAFCVGVPENGKVKVLHLSHVKTTSKASHGSRLRTIFMELERIFSQYPNVTDVVREKGFSRHAITTQTLFKVVGVSDLVSHHFGYGEVHEIPPTTVKKAVTGDGKADKQEVANAVTLHYLAKPIKFANDDESDACAVVVAYMKQNKMI